MAQRGAPKGNTNALKHGFYARSFRNIDITDLDNLTSLDEQLASEIALLRVLIRKTFESAIQDETNMDEPVDWTHQLSAIGAACTRLSNLLRTQSILTGSQDTGAGHALSEALAQVTRELKLKV